MRTVMTCLLMLATAPLAAADNARLAELFAQDQAARQNVPQQLDAEAAKRFMEADAKRKEAALAIVRAGDLRTASDYLHAAVLLQHGDGAEDYRLAHALATLAVTLDPDIGSGKWLMAASWDRLMDSYSRPQWYGTQYTFDRASRRWQMLPVDESALSDAERVRLLGMTLEEARQKIAERNTGAAPGN